MKITAIALNTWRETLRDRLLVAVFGVLAVGLLLTFLLEGHDANPGALIDLSLTLSNALGTFIAIFLGTSLVHKEMDRRTLYIVLSKPITRFQFLVGKYLGLMLTLTAVVLIVTVGLSAVMLASGQFDPRIYALCVALWVQLALVTAIAFCFSTITSGILSALYTLGLFIVGQNVLMIRDFADTEIRLNKFNYYGGHAMYLLLPHFEPMNFKNLLLYGHALNWQSWGWGMAYGACISAAFLAFASVAWEGRELR